MRIKRIILGIALVLFIANGFGQSFGKLLKESVLQDAPAEMMILGLHNTGDKKAFKKLFYAGQIEMRKGNYPKAEEYYLEAYKIFKKDNIHKKEHYDLLDEIALIYIKQGNYYKAQEFIAESSILRNARFSRNNPARYKPYLAKAELKLAEGDPEMAGKYLALFQNAIRYSNYYTRRETHNYANSYRMLYLIKRDDSIANNLKRRIARQNHHLQKHRWTKSQAGKNFLRRIESKVFLSEAHYMAGDYEKALKISNAAKKLYNSHITYESEELIGLNISRGLIFEKLNMTDSAAHTFSLACKEQVTLINQNFSRLSTLEKKQFYQRSKRTLNTIYGFALRNLEANNRLPQEFTNELFNTRLTTKAIILSESNKLFEKLIASRNQEIQKLYAEWKQKKNRYALLVSLGETSTDQRASLLQDINDIEKKLATHNKIFEPALAATTYLDIQENISDGDQAIEIIRTTNNGTPRYIAMSLSKKGEPSISLLELSNESETKDFKVYNTSILYDITDTKSRGIFLEPLTSITEENTNRLFISPDGIYNQINLNLLQYYNENTPSFDIINLTTLRTLIKEKKPVEIGTALLLGRPNYYENNVESNNTTSTLRSGINDLPGTETEVLKIKESLEGENVEVEILLGDDADEDHLKNAASANILHFATHGFFETKKNTDPMISSGLLLAHLDVKNAATEGQDNVLTAYEASLLDLTETQITVLSACETGLGTIEDGEGVYGLQRAFEVAGVRYVLMSMWKVDDAATQQLMSHMYKEFAQTKDLRLAFIHAQEQLKETYPDRSKWGAFKLIGY